MNKWIWGLCLVLLVACQENQSVETVVDNEELKAIYAADQADRKSMDIDWSEIYPRDQERQKRVSELLQNGLVRTSEDYANAAMVFQHGDDTTASRMAVELMRKAIELDASRNKWLLAAAIDRDLMRRELPQIYGTQFVRSGAEDPWELYTLDPTQISDAERKEYGVETLAEQQEKLRLMNKKTLMELAQAGIEIDSILRLIDNADLETSEFNLSEFGLNTFGYQLMAQDKLEEALKIFERNTKLCPEAFNTFDSYGECLLKMGKTESAIAAYQKSLDLNPENEGAARILDEIRE